MWRSVACVDGYNKMVDAKRFAHVSGSWSNVLRGSRMWFAIVVFLLLLLVPVFVTYLKYKSKATTTTPPVSGEAAADHTFSLFNSSG